MNIQRYICYIDRRTKESEEEDEISGFFDKIC